MLHISSTSCLNRHYVDTFPCPLIPFMIRTFSPQFELDAHIELRCSFFRGGYLCAPLRSMDLRSYLSCSAKLLLRLHLWPLGLVIFICLFHWRAETALATCLHQYQKALSICSSKCFLCQFAGVTGDGT